MYSVVSRSNFSVEVIITRRSFSLFPIFSSIGHVYVSSFPNGDSSLGFEDIEEFIHREWVKWKWFRWFWSTRVMYELLDELRNVGVIIDNDTAVHNILTEFSQDLKSSSGQSQWAENANTRQSGDKALSCGESKLKLRSEHSSNEALVTRFCNQPGRINIARHRIASSSILQPNPSWPLGARFECDSYRLRRWISPCSTPSIVNGRWKCMDQWPWSFTTFRRKFSWSGNWILKSSSLIFGSAISAGGTGHSIEGHGSIFSIL